MEVVSRGFRGDSHHVSEGRLSKGRRFHSKSSPPRYRKVLKQIGDLKSDLDFS